MFYKEIAKSKTSLKIPVFASGKFSHSKYDPEREAEIFASNANAKKNENSSFQNARFAVIFGIAGGYHIKAFMKKNPHCKILAFENSSEDFEFLKREIPCVNEIAKNENFLAAFLENAEKAILENYFPALDGGVLILTLRSWEEEDKEGFQKIFSAIQNALKKVAADFSVQSHFGSLWQKNIFCNLKTLSKMQDDFLSPHFFCENAGQKKIAAVIAAGPSLDQSLEILKRERKKYFVIATDTAFKTLFRSGIICDIAVSIDAQHLSAEHFVGTKAAAKKTIFVLTLDASSSVAISLLKNKAHTVFASSGHPLIEAASKFSDHPFFRLESGSGTVTIAALDLAKKMGFFRAEVFGADFAYSKGKPYAKGTYLEELYKKNESRIQNFQSDFCKLMFRTPLKKFFEEGNFFFKNEILFSYQKSFEAWLLQNAKNFSKEKSVWQIEFSPTKTQSENFLKDFFSTPKFDLHSFKNEIQFKTQNEISKIENSNSQNEIPLKIKNDISLAALPYMAFLKNKNPAFGPQENFAIAMKTILRYNGLL